MSKNFDILAYIMGQKAAGGGGGGGSSTLSGLTDVDISNPTNGQTLVYNATSGKWENGAGGGGASLVMPNISITIDGHTATATCDMTRAAIASAIENGAICIARISGFGGPFVYRFTGNVLVNEGADEPPFPPIPAYVSVTIYDVDANGDVMWTTINIFDTKCEVLIDYTISNSQ